MYKLGKSSCACLDKKTVKYMYTFFEKNLKFHCSLWKIFVWKASRLFWSFLPLSTVCFWKLSCSFFGFLPIISEGLSFLLFFFRWISLHLSMNLILECKLWSQIAIKIKRFGHRVKISNRWVAGSGCWVKRSVRLGKISEWNLVNN